MSFPLSFLSCVTATIVLNIFTSVYKKQELSKLLQTLYELEKYDEKWKISTGQMLIRTQKGACQKANLIHNKRNNTPDKLSEINPSKVSPRQFNVCESKNLHIQVHDSRRLVTGESELKYKNISALSTRGFATSSKFHALPPLTYWLKSHILKSKLREVPTKKMICALVGLRVVLTAVQGYLSASVPGLSVERSLMENLPYLVRERELTLMAHISL